MDVTGTMNSDKYIQTLDDNLWPAIAKNFPNSDYIFQEDNAPCHNSYRIVVWKKRECCLAHLRIRADLGIPHSGVHSKSSYLYTKATLICNNFIGSYHQILIRKGKLQFLILMLYEP